MEMGIIAGSALSEIVLDKEEDLGGQTDDGIEVD